MSKRRAAAAGLVGLVLAAGCGGGGGGGGGAASAKEPTLPPGKLDGARADVTPGGKAPEKAPATPAVPPAPSGPIDATFDQKIGRAHV